MKQTKRILSLLLAVVMTVSLFTVSASAATSASDRETKVQVLFALGLFKGYDNTGTNFGLEDGVTREQALLFLIRILGEEKAAAAWTGAQPYTDVPSGNYYYPYIGYAKAKGYTNGIGNNLFGLGQSANMTQMAAFALRGLGYSEAAGDFTYPNSVPFAVSLGILDSAAVPATFTRGDAVDILDGAVAAKVKGQNYTLLEKLVSVGAVTQAQVEKAAAIAGGTAQPQSDIASGTYTLKCMSNSLRMTSGKLELRDTSPAQTFTITNKNGYSYIQAESGSYLGLTSLANGTQLVAVSNPYSWLIQKQSGSTYTIRPAEKPEMVVNASEEKSTNGTKVLIWTHSGAPKNTLITFTAATKQVAVTGVKLDQTSASVAVGKTIQLTGTISPFNATNQDVTWTSSAPTIAKVDSDGKVTGVKLGTATITVKTADGGKTATCAITVGNVPVTGIKLDQTTATVAVGQTTQLTGTISPANATNQNVTWTSSATTVATVSSTGVVKGIKAGTATITAKTTDGSKTATCKVTVTAAAAVIKGNFELQNQTGKTIKELYMTTSNNTDWGTNLMPQNGTLASGYAVTLEISFNQSTKYDILAKYSDGTQGDFRGLSFANATNQGGVLVLKGSDVTLYPQITVPVTLFNMTGAKINELRFSSSKNADWGESRGSIDSGSSLALTFTLSAYDTKFDLKAKRASDSLEFRGMDLTDVPASGAKFYLYLQNGQPQMSTTKPTVEEVVDKTVKIYNCHTSNMTRIECSSVKMDSWSSNLITTTVKPDATGSIIVPVSASDYEFDLRVTYADGKTATFSKYDFRSFTSGSTLYAYFENGSPVLSTNKPAASETYTNKTLNLYNNHPLGATSIRISSTKNESWGPNLLTSTLASGSKVEILIPVSASDYTYDIEFQYADGSSATYSAYSFKNFTSGGTLYAYIEGSGAYLSTTKRAIARTVTITFINSSSKDIVELYASLAAQEIWGNNLISGSSSSLRVQFTVTDNDYLYDLRLVDASGNEYTLYDLDLSGVTGSANFEIVNAGSGLGWK